MKFLAVAPVCKFIPISLRVGGRGLFTHREVRGLFFSVSDPQNVIQFAQVDSTFLFSVSQT